MKQETSNDKNNNETYFLIVSLTTKTTGLLLNDVNSGINNKKANRYNLFFR